MAQGSGLRAQGSGLRAQGHAFLIIAHADYDLLFRLLKNLDHENHSIFIHIDKKSKLTQDDIDLLNSACASAKIFFIERKKVAWGGFSQIDCELRLLETASRYNFDYYHLLSGVDYPIKKIKFIHEFFERNKGREFVSLSNPEWCESWASRYNLYYFFQESLGRDALPRFRGVKNFIKNFKLLPKKLFSVLNTKLLKIQNILGVKRSRKYNNIKFAGGANWFSITHNFALYLIQRRPEIEKYFKYSFCCDEFFVQTMLVNSEFYKNNYGSNMREIDWDRGSPYTFDYRDYNSLINSQNLFCRKVSFNTPEQKSLIDKLDEYLN